MFISQQNLIIKTKILCNRLLEIDCCMTLLSTLSERNVLLSTLAAIPQTLWFELTLAPIVKNSTLPVGPYF